MSSNFLRTGGRTSGRTVSFVSNSHGLENLITKWTSLCPFVTRFLLGLQSRGCVFWIVAANVEMMKSATRGIIRSRLLLYLLHVPAAGRSIFFFEVAGGDSFGFSSVPRSLPSPSFLTIVECFVFCRGLVRQSANCCIVGTYYTTMLFCSINSRVKWYRTWICLVLLWNSGFSDNLMALWLSTRILVGLVCGWPISQRNLLSHTVSRAAEARAMYSASVLQSEVMGCLWLDHDTSFFPATNINPLVDFLST